MVPFVNQQGLNFCQKSETNLGRHLLKTRYHYSCIIEIICCSKIQNIKLLQSYVSLRDKFKMLIIMSLIKLSTGVGRKKVVLKFVTNYYISFAATTLVLRDYSKLLSLRVVQRVVIVLISNKVTKEQRISFSLKTMTSSYQRVHTAHVSSCPAI